MNDFERAVKVIDELLVLFCLNNDMDYNIVREGLRLIEQARQQNPSHPITLSLSTYMNHEGYTT